MTYTSLLNVRDWHVARINRFVARQAHKTEDVIDLARSVSIANIIADVVGGIDPIQMPSNWMTMLSALDRRAA